MSDLIESKWLKDPRLQEAAQALSKTRVSAIICDESWRLVWASDELKNLFDEWDEEKLGYGKHLVEVYTSDTWGNKVTEESQMRFLMEEFPMLFQDTPGGKEGLVEALCRSAETWEEPPSWTGNVIPDKSAIDAIISALEPVNPPPIHTSYFDFVQGDLPPLRVVETSMRLQDPEGNFFGTVVMYSPGLSAKVLTLVARGDEEMYERMVRLFEPGRRQAAVLFADLQDSTALSRRLPSSAYFRLIRAITTASDEVIAGRKGIVGKHAGDGVTAFFLAEDVGSSSGAAKAVIEAARDILVAARRRGQRGGRGDGAGGSRRLSRQRRHPLGRHAVHGTAGHRRTPRGDRAG